MLLLRCRAHLRPRRPPEFGTKVARHRAVLALFLGLSGCGADVGDRYFPATPSPAQSAKPKEAGKVYSFTQKGLEHIVAEVSVARQLPVDHTIAIEQLDHDAFLAEFRAHNKHDAKVRRANDAFGKGFDLGAQDEGEKDDLVASQLLGFYDPKKDRIFVPAVTEPTLEKLFIDSGVVAHEVEHALQAQHFKNLREPKTSDEAIAELSLIEGDSQLAMAAYFGTENGEPIGRTVRRVTDATKRVPIAALAKANEGGTLALARTQERLDFPYKEGLLFVSDLYRAGGFGLVNEAFADAPTTTEQILHPQKYLDGESAREVRIPKIPSGWSGVVTDVLGELDTRIILSRCLDKATASNASLGWGGDRFAIFQTPEKLVAMTWVSAWDSEEDAKEAESALSSSGDCWQGGSNEALASSGERVVERRGDVVVFLRGVPAANRASIKADLFGAVAAKPKPTKRSSSVIPPRVPLPEPTPGSLNGDVYTNDWLGIVGRIPPGLTARVSDDNMDLTIDRPNTLIYGGVTFSLRIANDEQNEHTFEEFQAGFAKLVEKDGLTLDSQGTRAVDTALGKGVERTWKVHGTEGGMRMILLPICVGSGSIVFVEGFGDARAKQVLDDWKSSFRWTNGRNLTACDYLDPK